jgi:hypothetical protein
MTAKAGETLLTVMHNRKMNIFLDHQFYFHGHGITPLGLFLPRKIKESSNVLGFDAV